MDSGRVWRVYLARLGWGDQDRPDWVAWLQEEADRSPLPLLSQPALVFRAHLHSRNLRTGRARQVTVRQDWGLGPGERLQCFDCSQAAVVVGTSGGCVLGWSLPAATCPGSVLHTPGSNYIPSYHTVI